MFETIWTTTIVKSQQNVHFNSNKRDTDARGIHHGVLFSFMVLEMNERIAGSVLWSVTRMSEKVPKKGGVDLRRYNDWELDSMYVNFLDLEWALSELDCIQIILLYGEAAGRCI